MSSEDGSQESLTDQGKQLLDKISAMASETSGDPTEMIVVMFDHESQASQVLYTLGRLEDERLVDLGKAAVLTRPASDGTLRIEETRDLEQLRASVARGENAVGRGR